MNKFKFFNMITKFFNRKNKQVSKRELDSYLSRLSEIDYKNQYSLIEALCNKFIDAKLLAIDKTVSQKIEDNTKLADLVNKKTELFVKVSKTLTDNLERTVKKLNNVLSSIEEDSAKLENEISERVKQVESNNRYKDLLQQSYLLDKAMRLAKIEVNTIERVALEKAYNGFSNALNLITQEEEIKG